ncbi:hypothetical protein [Roseomonas chloroacetimidivorans]|uniref:hypothetical protein n=1 Tax=Roseomonas chloroacetimidivorans TaxID=1766656 RepID=UPI003C77CB5F
MSHPTNGELGKAAYEAWMRVRQTQPDPPAYKAWEDLQDSTQRYWIKEAVWMRPRPTAPAASREEGK